MAQTHTWFATESDLQHIVGWLRDAGAHAIGTRGLDPELPADGTEWTLHFPSVGPIEFWPDQIRLTEYPEGTPRWRKAVVTQMEQARSPEIRRVDVDRSAVAGLRLPVLRDANFWVAGCLWFPGSRLRQVFPDLARLCSRFQRWIRRYPTVYNNTNGDDDLPYGYQLCMTGIVQRVVALPGAEALLRQGGFMVDHMTSESNYAEFKQRLELAGFYNPPAP